MERESNPTLPAATEQQQGPELVQPKGPKRHVREPQLRALIAEDVRRRGSAKAAQIWGITVHAAWDCRVEALERLIRRVESAIAAQSRRAA